MTLQLTHNEAMQLIQQNSGQTIKLQTVNDNTVNVAYNVQISVPVLGKVNKDVGIGLTVDKVEDKDVFLHYATGVHGGDTIVNMLLSAIPVLAKTQALQKDGDGLIVHLNEIKWVRESLKSISLNSLSFTSDGILVGFSAIP